MLGPKTDILNWDDYFMAIAKLCAMRSRDPQTQVGAVLVDELNHIVGTGYNGLPKNCDPNNFPWDREGDFLNTKYAYICHSEINAIDNADKTRLRGSRIYTTLFPCNSCAKSIIQNGIVEVIYFSNKYYATNESIAARKLFGEAKIKTMAYVQKEKPIVIYLKE